MMTTTAFMKENSALPNGESFSRVIRKEELNNNCYTKCSNSGRCKSIRRRNRTELTIMFLASYLLVFTVVATSFVTSQPVTNLRHTARNNKLTEKMATTTISLQQTILSPPSSSSFSASDSQLNRNTGRDAATVTTTDVVGVTAEKQGVKNQHDNLSSVEPLAIPMVQQMKGENNMEELSNPFENGVVTTTAAAAAMEESDVSAGNNSNDNVVPLTMTNMLRNRSTRTGTTMSGDKWKEGKKVGRVEDKDKVMLTDDVKGSSSTVNPVSSSSSSLPSQNGNSPLEAAVAHSRNNDVDNVDKAEVYDKRDEKRRKVNIISETEGIPLQEQQLTHSKQNLIVSQSQRFMSTAASRVTEKQAKEMTVTTITPTAAKDKALLPRQGERNDGNGAHDDADYYGPGSTTSGYANVVNNHVNFAEKKAVAEERRRTQKQQGGLFDTDYSNKTRTSTGTGTPLAKLADESQSNDKGNGDGTPAATAVNGKSSFLSTAAADSSSTSPGNLMKSTRGRSRPVTEMNSISLSPVPVAGTASAADNENNKKEERSHDSLAGENSKEEYNAHQQNPYQQQHYFEDDYAYDSPVSFASTTTGLTGEDGSGETNDEYPPSPLSSQGEPSSSLSSPLLMNKWIKTLVKLSQCRANCLDQAGIHLWDSDSASLTLAQSDLLENHADNQEEERASTASSGASSSLLPLPSTSTPNWSDLNKKEKPKTLVVYPEQMKEKRSSHPLVPPFPTASTTPGRTIKVTPGKSMKYYELSTCQALCRSHFPLHSSHNNDDHDKRKLQTGLSTNGEKEDITHNSRNNSNNIINGSFNSDATSRITSAGNNGNGHNGSNNNNSDNNNSNENFESGAVVDAHDRKSDDNNPHQQHRLQEEQEYVQQQQHYYSLPTFFTTAFPTSEQVGGTSASMAFGGGNNGMPLTKETLEVQENSEENKNKGRHSEKTGKAVETSSANNFETFPSEPGLKVRQLPGRKRKENDEHYENSFSSAFPIIELSWPGSQEERDDADNNKSSNPEGTPAQVKDKAGIHLKKEKTAQRPADAMNVVYSIIVEESWNGADGTGQQRRWKLIDQIVARTTTQISLPLLPIVCQEEEEKVQSEQKNNQQEKMSLTEQKKGISDGEAGAFQEEEKIMKRNEPARMKTIKPLPPPPLPSQDDQQERNKALFADLPSKVTLRVLAVNREGLEKVYSAQVKVNNSFWDYHLNEQEKIGRHIENLNQEQADDSKTWTASDSHNNKSRISSSPVVAAASPTAVEEMKKFSGNEKTGNQKKKGSGSSSSIIIGEQIEKVTGKLDKKVAKERKGGEELDEDAETTTTKYFVDGSNENSNQILVFPSSESLRDTLGRGLSGEMKVKKLMTRLKLKQKKNENEVENGQHNHDHLSNLVEIPSPGRREPEADFLSERSGNRISNEVKISLQAKSGESDKSEDVKTSQNWGLHTVSMIYQKFLVVTQVTWDYPGEEADEGKAENDGETTNFSNSTNNANHNKTGIKLEEQLSFSKTKALPSTLAGKKWKGCGGRASNSNGGSGVDSSSKQPEQEEEQQLNFLLSWEIFGGGLRGNLVTDTCSASISLWPDTAYIIQVGLITPNKVDPNSSSDGMTKTNGEDSYAAYLTAWQEKASRSQLMTGPNNKRENLLSNHVPYVSNYVDENTEHAEHDHQRTLGQSSKDNAEIVTESASLSSLSSSDVTPSSFDPLVLPESITFPFDGEPKVTIKSERILVNTTRDRSTGNLDVDLPRTIHNQDKVTPGNSQSNNHFLTAEMKRNGGEEEGGENDEEEAVAQMRVTTKNSGSKNDHSSAGINDKGNVSPITITSTKTGHFENEPGPAFEEEEADQRLMYRFQQDQPEAEILPPLASLSETVPLSFSSRQGKVGETAAAAGVNEDATADQENSSVWSDEDEDEATDQDESLFARSLAHQNHHLQKQHQHSGMKNNNNNPPPPHFRSVSLPQPHIQTAEDVERQLNSNIEEKSLASKFHSFMTVKSFYQSLYQSLSRNTLELNSHSRYPNVFTITGTNEGNGGKRGNGSSVETGNSAVGDSNVGPLLIGEFGNSNRTGYLFSSTHTGEDDDADGIKGKLYTLFVILVISFVIFLFVVAVVGFCVLTSSIKENYKYFVPKKVRVWTTVGQLIKGPNSNQAGTSSSSSGGGGGGRLLFTDSAEGSFYPRRLQEEPDYEDFDEDNDDFDPDEDEEDVTSVADTEEEDEVDSDCDCHCGVQQDNAIVEVEEEDENSFSLNERCSSDRVKLIKDGEESSVELIAPVDDDEDNEEEINEERNNGRIGESSYNNSNSSSSGISNRCGGSYHHHHHHGGNCDNNNPCYHTTPGAVAGARIFQQSAPAPTVKASPVAAALSSLRKNFHRVSSSSSKQQHHHLQQTSRNHSHNHHHPHCQYYHHKRKSDTRIDVTGGGSRNNKNLPNPRQEGYY